MMQTSWYPLGELQRFLDRATNVAIELAGGDVTPQQLRGGQRAASIVKAREILIHVLRRTFFVDRTNGIGSMIFICVNCPAPEDWSPVSTPMLAHWLHKDHSAIVLVLARDRYAEDVEKACRILGKEYPGRLSMEIRRERPPRSRPLPVPHVS